MTSNEWKEKLDKLALAIPYDKGALMQEVQVSVSMYATAVEAKATLATACERARLTCEEVEARTSQAHRQMCVDSGIKVTEAGIKEGVSLDKEVRKARQTLGTWEMLSSRAGLLQDAVRQRMSMLKLAVDLELAAHAADGFPAAVDKAVKKRRR